MDSVTMSCFIYAPGNIWGLLPRLRSVKLLKRCMPLYVDVSNNQLPLLALLLYIHLTLTIVIDIMFYVFIWHLLIANLYLVVYVLYVDVFLFV